MVCRGVFYAITPDQAQALMAASDDDALLEVVERVESSDEDNLGRCDKAWDAIHRTLTDGFCQFGNGAEPLRHCVLGPNQLHRGSSYIVSLVSPDKVKEVSAALTLITRQWFDDRYGTIDPSDYTEHSDHDLEYTWDWFQEVRELYGKAAERDRFVVFVVDQ